MRPTLTGELVSRCLPSRVRRAGITLSSIALCAFVASLTVTVGANADSLDPAAGQFIPVSPVTIVDSGAASPIGWAGKLQPGDTKTLTVTSALGISDASTVEAVYLQVTTRDGVRSGTTNNGNLYVWPAGEDRPSLAIVPNSATGAPAENSAFIQVGTGGAISFYNGTGSTAVNVTASLQGYVTSATSTLTGAPFVPLPLKRIISTQTGTGGRTTALTPTNPMTYDVLHNSTAGLPPSGVAAVAFNLGGNGATADCAVSARTTGSTGGAYPTVNIYGGNWNQSLVIVSPDSSGNVTFTTTCASVNIYVDVEGYYLAASSTSAGDYYVPLSAPLAIVDTRTNLGIAGAMTGTREVDGIPIVGVPGMPTDGVDAVALALGTVNGTTRAYDTVWSAGSAKPSDSSSIDVDPSIPESNLIFVKPGHQTPGDAAGIDVATWSSAATASHDLTVNIQGYFAAPTAPPAVANPTVATDGTSAFLTWQTPPSDGGAAITSYTVAATPSDIPTQTTLETDLYLPNVTSMHTFTIRAVNAVGPGTPATAVAVANDGIDDDSGQGAPAANQTPIIDDVTSVTSDLGWPLAASDGVALVDSGSSSVNGYSSSNAAAASDGSTVRSFATETVSPDEMGSPTNIAVASEPALGTFSLTGVVLDEVTGNAVSGATVGFTPAGGRQVLTTSDSNGVFTFVNFPAASTGTVHALSVTAAGYGVYTETADYFPNEPLEMTVSLETTSQSIDDTSNPDLLAQAEASSTSSAAYTSPTRVPPSVVLGMQPIDKNCTSNVAPTKFVRYPWRMYLAKVMHSENESALSNPPAAKANASAASNYAWWYVLHAPYGNSYSLRNSTDSMCFRPSAPNEPSWRRQVDAILPYRVVNANLGIALTQFASLRSPPSCSPWYFLFPQASHPVWTLDQGGSIQCSNSRWQGVLNVFYSRAGYGVADIKRPTNPSVIYQTFADHANIQFPSIQLRNNVLSHVGWSYQVIEATLSNPSHYVTLWQGGWDSTIRNVREDRDVTYNTAINGDRCTTDIMVRAWNPAGWSSWVDFGNVCA